MPDTLVRDDLGELKVHCVTWCLVKCESLIPDKGSSRVVRTKGGSVYRFDGDESMYVDSPNATKSESCVPAWRGCCGYRHTKPLEMLCNPKVR